MQHRVATRVKIFDENHNQLDDALAIYFQSPQSFTGENVLEVSLHASPFIVEKFLHLLSSIKNFRHAKAGEFCLQAYENKKITLNEAEAINKLVLSESKIQHKLAINELNGSSFDYFHTIKQKLLKILSLLETYIDFSEEEAISLNFLQEIQKNTSDLIHTIQKTIKFAQKKENYDLQIAILGKPNVGKSSLFNALCSSEDAIVSEIAGTTRDTLKKILNISGFKVELIDTAGIRESNETIEKIGIERAKNIAIKSDIILLLKEKEGEVICDLSEFRGKVLTVFTKTDIYGKRGTNEINISTAKNDISSLEKAIEEILNEHFQEAQSIGFLCNERQKSILEKTLKDLSNINIAQSIELISEDFRHILHCISMLTGSIESEDILGEIFSSFCIGK